MILRSRSFDLLVLIRDTNFDYSSKNNNNNCTDNNNGNNEKRKLKKYMNLLYILFGGRKKGVKGGREI